MTNKWQEITVKTNQEGVEVVANAFMEAGAGGVAIHDPQLIASYKESGVWDYDIFTQEDIASQEVRVVGYLPLNKQLMDRLMLLEQLCKEALINFEIILAEVAEEDWATAWKAYYKPEKVSELLVIKPTWEPYQPQEGELILELDPGMAFGTGTHPTTVMCLKALEKYLTKGQSVIDVGTGSGVLAIAAAKLGASQVLAIDLDDVAVKVAHENVAINNVADRVTVLQGNLLDMQKEQTQTVVANIIASIIIKLIPDVVSGLVSGGLFITSGIIQDRLPEVVEALEKGHFIIKEIYREGEWAAVVAHKE